MSRTSSMLATLLLTPTFLILSIPAGADTPVGSPTFESIGLTWTRPDAVPTGTDPSCSVRFHPNGDPTWREGLPLPYTGSGTTGECRGSLVNLLPGTNYFIELTATDASGPKKKSLMVKTWSDRFVEGAQFTIPVATPRTTTLTIDASQSPTDGTYYVVRPDSSDPNAVAVIDVSGTNQDYALVIKAHHVIVRNLILRGGRKGTILLGDVPVNDDPPPPGGLPGDADVHDIVIQNNDISGWGTTHNETGYGVNQQSGIQSRTNKMTNLVIQRNRIHHPASDSNNWSELNTLNTNENSMCHPNGPQGITVFNSLGHTVVRYNEIYSDNEHRFDDGMGELRNNSNAGFPSNDSDIYGNYVSHVWDDGIEAEGGMKNVRVWGNMIGEAYHPFGMSYVLIGPAYLWRNLSLYSQTDDEVTYGQSFLKGSSVDTNAGRLYIFNNMPLTEPPQLSRRLVGVSHAA